MNAPPTALLAQFFPGDAQVDMLPQPPLLERLLFENPWPLAALFIIAAVLAGAFLHRAGKDRNAGVAAVVLLVLAGAVVAASALVTTERERLADLAKHTVDSVMAADDAAVGAVLAPDVTLILLGHDTRMSRQGMLNIVASDVGRRYGVPEHRVQTVQASVDGPNVARTQMQVRAHVDRLGRAVGSWWRLHWRRDSDGRWTITSVEALQIDGVPRGTQIQP